MKSNHAYRQFFYQIISRKVNRKLVILRSVLAVLLICSLVYLSLERRWIGMNPLQNYQLSSISNVTTDSEGNVYMVTDSAQNLVKLSPSGELLNIFKTRDTDISSITQVCVGGDERIYIHDTVIASGVRIDKERIWSMNSQFADLRLESEYKSPEDAMKRYITGLFPTKSGVGMLYRSENDLSLYESNGRFCSFLPMANAEQKVLFSTMDYKTSKVYYVSFDGKVCLYNSLQEDTVLYDSADHPGSVPQNLSLYDGMLYVSDLGYRDILCINPEQGTLARIHPEGERLDRSIMVHVSASDSGIYGTGEYTLYHTADGTQWDAANDVSYSSFCLLLILLSWLAILIILLELVIILMTIGHVIIKRANVYARISILIIVGVIGIATLFMGTLLPEFNAQMNKQIYDMELLAASATVERIPVESFLALDSPSDYMSKDYVAVRDAIRSVFVTEDASASSFYCTCYRMIDGTVTLNYTMEDICVVYPYDWEYEGTDMQDVMEQGNPHFYETNSSTGSYIFVQYPFRDEHGKILGFLEVGTDIKSVRARNNEIYSSLLINVAAITIVIILIVIELMHYYQGKRTYLDLKAKETKVMLPAEIFRYITFLIFFFTNVTCAILPIHVIKLAEESRLHVLSTEMMAAIPISAEVVAGAIFSALGGKIIGKLGAKKAILLSCILFSVGLGLRAIPLISIITLGSFLNGVGWGILLIMVNVQIAELPEDEKDKGYAYYSISSISGINCAIVIGGFLVQWIDYTTLFLITAIGSLSLFFVCNRFLADNMPESEEENFRIKDEIKDGLKFVCKPRILLFFTLSLIPLLICGYFLNYMFPIIGTEWGLSETNIGYALMLSGLSSVIFGTPLTEFFAKRNLRAFGLAVSAVLYAEAFLCVALMQNVPSLLVAIFLIGISNSFGIPLFTGYFTELKEVKDYGYDRGFGVYSIIENGAQSLASFVLGLVFIIGLAKGMLLVAGILVGLSVVFLLTAKILAKRYETKGGENP